MKAKWITPLLLVFGAILLIGASTLNHSSFNPKINVWVKIVGLILVMMGLYRASKGAQSKDKSTQESTTQLKEGHHEDENRG